MVSCLRPPCSNPVIPPGECCGVCPTPPSNFFNTNLPCAILATSCCFSHPTACPIAGQVFQECGTACPPTCENPNPICTLQCVRGCACPRGTVLDPTRKRCIPPTNCPKCALLHHNNFYYSQS